MLIDPTVGPPLPRFRDIAGFLLKTATPRIPPKFWVFPSDVGAPKSGDVNYSCRPNYFQSNPTHMIKSPMSRTERQTTNDGNIALRASRSKT